MTSARSLLRRTTALGAIACVAPGGLTLGLSVASAGAGTRGACAGDQVFNWQTNETRLELVRNGETLAVDQYVLPASLAPGTYAIETIAYDGFVNPLSHRSLPHRVWLGNCLRSVVS